MAYNSHLQRHELFVATALIGAHSNASGGSFRQRDVKFLIELFSNWIESSFPGYALLTQNTQILRYISDLVAEGFARKMTRKGNPSYRLTRVGLVELVSRITAQTYVHRPTHFYFLFYFLRNYAPRIELLVEKEGRQFPHALRVELGDLLDVSALLQRELREAEKEIEKLNGRIHDARATSDLVHEALKEKPNIDQLVSEIEAKYPYELNSQKPLSELIAEIPLETRAWELESGNQHRISDIWEPCLFMLEGYKGTLQAYLKRL